MAVLRFSVLAVSCTSLYLLHAQLVLFSYLGPSRHSSWSTSPVPMGIFSWPLGLDMDSTGASYSSLSLLALYAKAALSTAKAIGNFLHFPRGMPKVVCYV